MEPNCKLPLQATLNLYKLLCRVLSRVLDLRRSCPHQVVLINVVVVVLVVVINVVIIYVAVIVVVSQVATVSGDAGFHSDQVPSSPNDNQEFFFAQKKLQKTFFSVEMDLFRIVMEGSNETKKLSGPMQNILTRGCWIESPKKLPLVSYRN